MAGISHEQFGAILASGDYSDLKITCQGTEYPVHRVIVSAASPFFKAALEGGFKEGLEGIIDFPTDDPATISSVVEYIYKARYTIAKSDTLTTASQSSSTIASNTASQDGGTMGHACDLNSAGCYWGMLSAHLDVYQVADRLGITKLKGVAFHKFVSIWEKRTPGTCIESKSYVATFPDTIEAVYGKTASDDMDLRAWFTKKMVDMHAVVAPLPKAKAAMEAHEAMAWHVGTKLQEDMAVIAEEMKALKAAKDQLDAKVDLQSRKRARGG